MIIMTMKVMTTRSMIAPGGNTRTKLIEITTTKAMLMMSTGTHEEHRHGTHADGHSDHAAHGHDTDFKRTDVRGFLQARYAPQ